MEEFPKVCCGFTSELLGEHLKASGLKPEMVIGQRVVCGKVEASHAWLEIEEVVIDLTADQFDGEKMPPVYVGPKSDWYLRWENQTRQAVSHLSNASGYREERAVLRETLRRAQL